MSYITLFIKRNIPKDKSVRKVLLMLVLSGIALINTNAQDTPVATDSTKKDTIRIDKKTFELGEMVVTATKQQERLLEAPVSIEKLDLKDIKQSAQPTFFDAIQNLKGLQVITPSLGFKVINARGFANTTNVRFVQMVDGMDNQAPHIGAPIANSLGPSDLDIYKVEIVPGSASAIYGMNAINGIANFITKDPFRFQGISANQKSGFNNFNSTYTSPTYYNETNVRVAKAINSKLAFKISGTFMKGTDWYANSRTDLNPTANISTGLTGASNPGADLVNQYGDESGNRKTLTLGGKQYVVSRTGYAEKDMADYGLQNIKADAALHYRPTENIEMAFTYRFADQNNVYQRTNRFRLDDYITQQYGLSLKTPSIQFKTYLTRENTGNSYNIRSMAENVDRSFKSDANWYTDFSNQFNTLTQNGSSVADAMTAARNFADQGRPEPNSDAVNNQIAKLRDINNWDIGAALRVKANLYHAEFQHDLTGKALDKIKENYKLSLMYGVDFRDYIIVPDGNYFINPTDANHNLNYWKVGGFAQATKLLFKEKVKINAVLRVDKNQYFEPKLNPRLAVVYSPNPGNSFRASIQNGYRFPSIFEAFSNINSGGRKRIGGLPVMSSSVFENSYTQASITAFQGAVQNDVNKNGMTQAAAITKAQGLLKKNPYTYLQPEQVTSFEVGYRTELFEKKLNIDMDFYYNIYQNLMAQIDANVPKTSNPDSIAIALQSSPKQNLYRLWTNSKTISYNYGASIGITYELPEKYKIGTNFTYAKLARKDKKDGLEDGFNTPEWTYNISFGNPAVYKMFGFNVNLRQQAAYLWQSALATGTVPGYITLDAQISAEVLQNILNVKIGASNLLNTYYYSFTGGPAIGGFYYLSATVNMGR